MWKGSRGVKTYAILYLYSTYVIIKMPAVMCHLVTEIFNNFAHLPAGFTWIKCQFCILMKGRWKSVPVLSAGGLKENAWLGLWYRESGICRNLLWLQSTLRKLLIRSGLAIKIIVLRHSFWEAARQRLTPQMRLSNMSRPA